MTIDPYSPMVMRDREGKNLSVKFVLTRHRSVYLDHGVRCNAGTMGVLPIGDVESLVAAFHLRGEEWKIHLVGGHNARCSLPVANIRLKLLELVRGKCRRFESHGEVGLRAWTVDKRDRFDPAFIDIFDQVLEVCGTTTSQFFWSRNDQTANVLKYSSLIPVCYIFTGRFKIPIRFVAPFSLSIRTGRGLRLSVNLM